MTDEKKEKKEKPISKIIADRDSVSLPEAHKPLSITNLPGMLDSHSAKSLAEKYQIEKSIFVADKAALIGLNSSKSLAEMYKLEKPQYMADIAASFGLNSSKSLAELYKLQKPQYMADIAASFGRNSSKSLAELYKLEKPQYMADIAASFGLNSSKSLAELYKYEKPQYMADIAARFGLNSSKSLAELYKLEKPQYMADIAARFGLNSSKSLAELYKIDKPQYLADIAARFGLNTNKGFLKATEIHRPQTVAEIIAKHGISIENGKVKLDDFRKSFQESIESKTHNFDSVQTDKTLSDIKLEKQQEGIATEKQSSTESNDFLEERIVKSVFLDAVGDLSKSVFEESQSDYSNAVNELVNSLPKDAENLEGFSLNECFNKLSEGAKEIFLYVFFKVLVPLMILILSGVAVDLVSDILKPQITAYICEHTDASDREIIKYINKISCNTPEANLKSNRIVRATHLNVRETPNQKSEILDVLPQWEIVTLIKKNENLNWSLIQYKNKNNELMEGWVLSRFLFKPNP